MTVLLDWTEEDSLTFSGDNLNAQVRDGVLALGFMDGQPNTDVDGAILVSREDVLRLQELLLAANKRGEFVWLGK